MEFFWQWGNAKENNGIHNVDTLLYSEGGLLGFYEGFGNFFMDNGILIYNVCSTVDQGYDRV